MVKRLISFLNKEISGLHQAAYLLGFFAILSQVLALFRDRLLASMFGAGNLLDIYYASFRVPDFVFATIASLVSVSVIIPFFIERAERSEHEAKHFLNNIFTFYMGVMVVVSSVLYALAPYLMKMLFPSISATESYMQLVTMTRILLLSPFFLGLSNLFASVTQAYKRFFVYAIAPVMYNIGIMFGIVVLYPQFGLSGLTLGVVIGAFLHMILQIGPVISQGFFPCITVPIDFKSIKKVVMTSLPRTITVSSNEITELFLVSFASFLVPGSISVFNFSFNLQSVPFSIIGVSYSLAAFPVLTRLFTTGESDKFVEHMVTTSKHILFWSIPVSILFIVLRAQVVRVILGAGKFNWDDTRLTAAALALFTISLFAQNLSTLFVRSYYAKGKTQTPLFINIFSSVLIIVISYVLVKAFNGSVVFEGFIESLLKVSGIAGTVVLMLPLGYTIGTIINVILHWIFFAQDHPSFPRTLYKVIFHATSASIIMGYVAYITLGLYGSMFSLNTLPSVFLQGLSAGIAGICAWICVLYILKNEELMLVWSTLHKKIWKAKVIGSDIQM